MWHTYLYSKLLSSRQNTISLQQPWLVSLSFKQKKTLDSPILIFIIKSFCIPLLNKLHQNQNLLVQLNHYYFTTNDVIKSSKFWAKKDFKTNKSERKKNFNCLRSDKSLRWYVLFVFNILNPEDEPGVSHHPVYELLGSRHNWLEYNDTSHRPLIFNRVRQWIGLLLTPLGTVICRL